MNRLALACGLLTACCVTASAQGPAKIDPAVLKGGAPIELVLLRDQGPVLLRLHVLSDGKPIQARWQEYIERWFDYLDRKGMGGLDEAALLGAPKAANMRNLVLGGNFFPQRGNALVMADLGKQADQKVTKSEFVEYYRKQGGSPVQLSAAPAEQTSQANDALFKLLDTNNDGKLSRAEIEAGREVIARLDTNDDELVSIPELMPGGAQAVAGRGAAVAQPQPFGVQPAPSQGSSYFYLNSDNTRVQLAFLLLARYDKNNDKRLSPKEIGLSAADFARLDKNRDGAVDLGELALFPTNAPAIEFVVHVRGNQNAPLVALKTGSVPAESVKLAGGQAVLNLGGADLIVQNTGGGQGQFVRVNQSQFLVQQFKAADTKNRGYVELSDLKDPQQQFLRQMFPVLDRNEDGKLTEMEVNAYFQMQGQAQNVFANFFVQEQGRNWFQILDTNRDGQLSPREIMSAWQRLGTYAKNDVVEAGALPLQFRVAFNAANVNQQQFVAVGGYGMGQAPGRDFNYPAHAPLWFRKMDRNRDGDVSRREFLGTREEFDRIDTNHDGLIDADEAAAATPKR